MSVKAVKKCWDFKKRDSYSETTISSFVIHTYTISLISDLTSHKFNILDLNRVNLIIKLIFKNVLLVLSSMVMSKI